MLRQIIKVTVFMMSFAILSGTKAFSDGSTIFDDVKQGTWRFEIIEGAGLSTDGKSDRKGDYYFTGSMSYTWPTYKSRTEIGVRLFPALIYYQDKNDKGEDDIVFAAAAGVLMRQYINIKREGFYWESGFSPLWNSRLFRCNAARWNFFSEIGAGYQFDKKWHIALKFQHISNAYTKSPNEGINALAFCLGFNF